ncbi:MAG: class II aldolase/adducin family protein [Ignavibacteriales bacterium]|nr:class II aldolase/adducin family protein [Ignavibacteriales bacterium]
MGQSLYSLKNEIIEVGKRMYARGYVASNDGNISVRLDENKILITPSGVSKGFINASDLIIVNLESAVLSGNKKPSSELPMHLQIYKERSDVMSVCHAHPIYATGFAVAGIPLDMCVLPEVIISLGIVPLVEYGTPGTSEYFNSMMKYLKQHDAFLLANHGVVTVGKDILSAYHKMETVEHFANIIFVSLQLGKINILPQEQIAKLISQREKFGMTTTAACAPQTEDAKSFSAKEKTEIPNKELIKKITDEILGQLHKQK